MAKKTAKKAAPKAGKTRGRRVASKSSPKFDAKKHIKLSVLAKKCNITYQSMYLKQQRTGVSAIPTNLDGVEVMAFTLEDAKKVEDNKALPMRKDSVSLMSLEKKLKISRPKLTNLLLKLRILPVKRQGEDHRQTLTVTTSESEKIIEKLNS